MPITIEYNMEKALIQKLDLLISETRKSKKHKIGVDLNRTTGASVRDFNIKGMDTGIRVSNSSNISIIGGVIDGSKSEPEFEQVLIALKNELLKSEKDESRIKSFLHWLFTKAPAVGFSANIPAQQMLQEIWAYLFG